VNNNDSIKEKENKRTDRGHKINSNLRGIKLLIILTVLAVLAPYPIDAVRNDPNLILKKIAKEMTAEDTVDVSYKYKSDVIGRKMIPLFDFTPEESTEYTFTVSNIVSEDDVFISMEVADSHLNNYLVADNLNDPGGDIEDTVFLPEKTNCYVIVEAISTDDRENYSGSFCISVTKAAEDARPNEVTETEPAIVRISEDSQNAVLFIPQESGLFSFSSKIISKDKAASSSISSITTADGKQVKRAEGICQLEGGLEYYVWVSADEQIKKKVNALVSCKKVETLDADQPGEYSINEGTVIEFTSRETQNLAVYSVSDGNIRCAVYDSMGFPINNDRNSGGEFSGNVNDFALVIQAQAGTRYLIYTDGKYTECKIVIARYIGDGSSLGPDDIEITEPEGEVTDEREAVAIQSSAE
jgi:hypothetical protein